MSGVCRALGVGARGLERLIAAGVIAPAVPRRGGRAAQYDALAVARTIIARHAAQGPRDRREVAQAKLLELRYRKEAGQVLDRGDVVRRGQGIAKVLTAVLLALPAQLVRDGVIPPAAAASAEAYLRARLDEAARFGDASALTGAPDADA